MATGLAAPVGAGDIPTMTIEKVVVGTPPPGATFEVEGTCETGGGGTSGFGLVFDGPGSQEPILVGSPGTTCSVAEPGTGGASSVSFSCTDVSGSQCQSENSFETEEGGSSVITITNTFDDPSTPITPETPATAVPGTPRFTG